MGKKAEESFELVWIEAERALTTALLRIEELQLKLTHTIIQRNLARHGRREQADRAAFLSRELTQLRAELLPQMWEGEEDANTSA